MFGKLALAGAVALTQFPPGYFPDPIPVTNPYIEKMYCDEGSGTGFKLMDGRWVGVSHVINLGNCRVDGLPILVVENDLEHDFAVFYVPGDRRRGGLTPDCSGFKTSQWYFATGHAWGGPLASVAIMYAPLLNIRQNPKGWSAFAWNRAIPGQSGGPVMNSLGQPVGTANAYDILWPITYSRELKGSSICR